MSSMETRYVCLLLLFYYVGVQGYHWLLLYRMELFPPVKVQRGLCRRSGEQKMGGMGVNFCGNYSFKILKA